MPRHHGALTVQSGLESLIMDTVSYNVVEVGSTVRLGIVDCDLQELGVGF